MASEGGDYYASKKTDDICDSFCSEDTKATFSMARLRCVLRGLDLKVLLLLFVIVPTCVLGIFLHGQKISYFLGWLCKFLGWLTKRRTVALRCASR
ncbi:beta-1,4-mannosyl-glycoprotein 4-beta-N-acetylglucosaminyltransferase [Ranunculus cassubicifolius]